VNDEAELLQRAREHDLNALGEIYDRYSGRLYRYIRSCVGDRETAEDLTAEAFLRMLNALDGYKFAQTSLSAWLYRIAHNLVVDHHRSRRPTLALLEPTPTAPGNPVEIAERRGLHERVRAALLELTPEQRQVIVLRFGHNMKAKEVGQVLRKSEAAIRKLQRRGLASLRRILEREQ